MSTKTVKRRQANGAKQLRIVVTNAAYAKLCRRSLKRLPARWKSRLNLLTFSRWEDVVLPSRRASTLFVTRLSDIPEEPGPRAWEGAETKHLLFLEGLPVEAVPSRLVRLNIRNSHRLHVAAERDAGSISDLVYRLVSGMAESGGPKPIVDAWMENEQLVILSPSFDRLSVPLEKMAKYIGTDESEIRAIEIDEDGRFLYWPHSDIHLGWEQLRQIVDPVSALADQQKTKTFNRGYGAAIRSLREEKVLKQSDISGLTARHLRRIEHGEQAASKATLGSLAQSHGLTLENYLKELAERFSEGASR